MKLLPFLIFLVSLHETYADKRFMREFMTIPPQSEFMFPDGASVVILLPRTNGDSLGWLLSQLSDPNGVCHHLGYEKVLEWKVMTTPDQWSGLISTETFAVIDENGIFRNRERSKLIWEIICRKKYITHPSIGINNYKMKEQGPEGITILRPYLGNGFFISGHANLTGVCRLFGYMQFISAETIPTKSGERHVIINLDGHFQSFARALPPLFLNSIICR